MPFSRNTTAPSVSKCGAAAGCVLRGSGLNNRGLRLRLLQVQARGNGGPIQGGFVILDAGDNVHARSLGPLVGQVTDAAAVVGIIRRAHPGCVSVVNASILIPEQR